MDTRKKMMFGIAAVVVAGVVYMGMGMFGGGSEEAGPAVIPNPDIPKPAASNTMQQRPAQQAPMTEREMQLMRLQQDTQAKYLAALNELQMLRVEKDIAEINKDISKAKLDTITAQKGIVDLLTPVKPVIPSDTYVQGIDQTASAQQATTTAATTQTTSPAPQADTASYTVVSVTKLRGEWTAVLGAQGKLFNVKVGDVLTADNSVVLFIDRSGVLLEKDGKRVKVSMVPII